MATATGDAQRVTAWFDSGALVRPRAAGRADLVDLVYGVAAACGVPEVADDGHARRLRRRVGDAEHVVFVLVDGLGLALLRHLAEATGAGFLAAHVAETLEVVFPSTTAAVLTTMATGEYPCEHGVPGWWTWFDDLGLMAETLPFVERFTKRPMLELGARFEDVFAGTSLLPRFVHRPLVVTRPYIVGSVYSCWWAGDCAGVGYASIPDAVERVLLRVREAREPTYTYLYLNQLDGICHERGIDDPQTSAVFAEIDRELARLHRVLDGSARIVATADHGHVNAADDWVLAHDHPLMGTLRGPPSGEARTPVFHVRAGMHDEFRARFVDEFDDAFALLAIDEVEELRLLGPAPLSRRARAHFGDFMAIAPEPHTIGYVPPGGKAHRNRGVHAGLTAEEMLVPLLLA